MADPTPTPTPERGELAGVILRGTITVWCVDCGHELTASFDNPAPEKIDVIPSLEIVCPTCSARHTKEQGHPVEAFVYVEVAAGPQLPTDEDDEDAIATGVAGEPAPEMAAS